jgi:hypothetical protein
VQGGILRNGGWQAAYWNSNLASLNVATGAVFDVWDGNAITVDALTGNGRVQNGSNSPRDTMLEIGAAGGSGTFSGIVGGGTRAGANRIALVKLGGGTQTLTGAATLSSLTISGGTLALNGGSLSINGSGANAGTLRLTGNAGFTVAGTFTNTGILDIMTWNGSLPANFVNNGIVIGRSKLKIDSALFQSGEFSVTFTAYAGYSYQLQSAADLSANTVWENVGSPVQGDGNQMTLTDPQPQAQKRFYRLRVDP